VFGATTAQRFALPALGWGRRSRPTGKMKRRRKLLEICAESPASGARFVRQPACLPECWREKDTTVKQANLLRITLFLAIIKKTVSKKDKNLNFRF
jgi:hypothetical protein